MSLTIRAMMTAAIAATRPSRDALWDDGWNFHRGLCPAAAHHTAAHQDLSERDPCAAPDIDDSTWRQINLPHDWSREDLPTREEDPEYPVLSARYGSWKVNPGDNSTWALPDFDDSEWLAARGGDDWRMYAPAFSARNAIRWYR